MKFFLKYKSLFFLVFFAPLVSFSQSDKAKVLAAYINNFANYTTWPQESKIDSFRIVIVTDNNDVIKEFQLFSKKRKIKKKPISLHSQPSYTNANNAHIIFLTSEKSNFVSNVYDDIEGKPILLVSEDYEDKPNTMINLYKTEKGQVMFEVNKANIINQNLSIDPEIILAGGTEIDVAGLYRKSQLNLRDLQKEMSKMVDSLNMVENNIALSIKQIKIKQKEIAEQKEIIANSLNRINEDKNKIADQKRILQSQKDSIRIKNNILRNQLNEIERQAKEMEEQEKVLKTKQNQIETLNSQIENLNSEMENKNSDLQDQMKIITRQKNTMFLLVIISLLIVSLGISIYISYRRNAQKRKILAQQKEEIENTLKEVKLLNTKLKDADQYKSVFLASMSHELRTPLNSIIGYTGILLMGMTGDLTEEQNKQLTKVKNNARHLLSLINDILDISKIEADRVELAIEEFPLKKMVEEVIETLFPKASEKNLDLSSYIDENITITTDYRRLKQVVLNLVTNAVNYSNSGKIQVFSELMAYNKYKIIVKDTGIGISDDEIPRLFQPFHQIDSSLTKSNSSGTGLGLYLCRKIMGLLGGEIAVKSQLGVGSEFIIIIPVKNI